MTALELAEQPTALYRWYGQEGRLLYVGISFNPVARAAGHAESQPWWSLVRTCAVQWYPTRTAAERAEARAIWEEEPVGNRRGTEHWRYRQAHPKPIASKPARSQLLTDLLAVMEPEEERAHSADLCQRLAHRWPTRYDDLNAGRLARALRDDGVRTVQINHRDVGGHVNRRGVRRVDLVRVRRATGQDMDKERT